MCIVRGYVTTCTSVVYTNVVALLLIECDHGDIRLAGRNTSTEGRIEVCIDGVWGTVTDDLWGTNDARVACRQLGFNSDGKLNLYIMSSDFHIQHMYMYM